MTQFVPALSFSYCNVNPLKEKKKNRLKKNNNTTEIILILHEDIRYIYIYIHTHSDIPMEITAEVQVISY